MAVGTKVVDLIGLHLLDDPDQVGAICEIAVMKDQPGVVLMGVLIKVIDPGGVETACSSLNPMHFVALLKQKLRKITAVLSRNTGDQSLF